MSQFYTVRNIWATLLLLGLLEGAALAQPSWTADWRRIGNSAVDFSLPGPASGAVDRVWFDAEGARIFALTAAGVIYTTEDLEGWQLVKQAAAPLVENAVSRRVPSGARLVRAQVRNSRKSYAAGAHIWRTENGGDAWENLTSYRGKSILGGNVLDLSVSPKDDEDRKSVV